MTENIFLMVSVLNESLEVMLKCGVYTDIFSTVFFFKIGVVAMIIVINSLISGFG